VTPSKPNRSEEGDARGIALGLLTRREHSRKELHQKLVRRGFDAAEISPLLDQLQAQRLQSDERFIESYIHARQTRGFGPVRIRLELKGRGITDAVIDAHLDERSGQWRDALYTLYRKRYRDEPADKYKERVRRSRFLQQRGFDAEMIRCLIKALSQGS
jgi:regulatory protein